MTKLWNRVVNWFENGDLMPPIILVSVPHYAQVLAAYDFWLFAAVLGFLLDIGHYRTVKAALSGRGWLWMVVLSIFSYGFHVAFYVLAGAGWWSMFLGGAVPVVIFALAWITKSERLDDKIRRSVVSVAKQELPKLPLATDGTPQLTSGKTETKAEIYARENGVSIRTAYRRLAEVDKGVDL